ncbi:MAG: hypothetical protein AB8G14_15135 [Ilumatobacter sp.]
MSNAYVFDNAPADGGVASVKETDGSGAASPVAFVLLLLTALVLAAVIVVLLVRGGGSDGPEIAMSSAIVHLDQIGRVR